MPVNDYRRGLHGERLLQALDAAVEWKDSAAAMPDYCGKQLEDVSCQRNYAVVRRCSRRCTEVERAEAAGTEENESMVVMVVVVV
jgi:hypothetical protein